MERAKEPRYLWMMKAGTLYMGLGASPMEHKRFLWSSTNRRPGARALVDKDGILKLEDELGNEVWSLGKVKRIPKEMTPWPILDRGGLMRRLVKSLGGKLKRLR